MRRGVSGIRKKISEGGKFFAAVAVVVLAVEFAMALSKARADLNISLLAPIYGIALGVLTVGGMRYGAAIAIGALLPAAFGHQTWGEGIALGFAAPGAAVFGAYIFRRIDFDSRLERIRDAFVMIALGGAAIPMLGTAAEVLLKTAFVEEVALADFQGLFLARWLAASVGSLVFLPFIFVWSAHSTFVPRGLQGVEIAGWLALLVFFALITFANWAPTDILLYPLELAIFPIMAWAAIRFGPRGTAAGVVVLAIMAARQLLSILGSSDESITQDPANIWIFVGIVSFTSVSLSAVLAELKAREQRIAENERRLRAFTDAMPDVAFVLSGRGDVRDIFAASGERDAHHGIQDRSAAIGRRVEALFDEGIAERFRQVIQAALTAASLQTLEYAIDGEDGRRHWFEARVMPMRASGALPEQVVWVAYDITARKASEESLERRDRILEATAIAQRYLLTKTEFEEALREALAEVGGSMNARRALVFSIGEDEGGEATVHVRAEWGVPRDDSASPFATLPDGARLENAFPGWGVQLRQDRIVREPAPSDSSNGARFSWQRVMALPLWVDRRLWGFLAFDRARADQAWESGEVSALRVIASSAAGFILMKQREDELRVQRDRADAASSAKGEFLAMMSHEIRTPMNAIIGYSDLLAQTELDDEQWSQLGTIKRSGNLLLDLINNILDYSKIESRSLQLETEPFDVEPLVCEALENTLIRAKEKAIELDYGIGRNVSERYAGDSHRLRQILINLLNNAVKFTERGSVHLHVQRASSGPSEDNSENLHFRVSDTGIGIPQDKLGVIFEPFSQADSSTTRQFGGTGLGLVICKRLVERMGGSIWVESVVGEGSSFHVRVPLQQVGSKAAASVELQGEPGDDDLESGLAERCPLRILVAEDEESNRMLTHAVLTKMGYDPVMAEDGAQALERLRNEVFDLALIDVQLPRIDGHELTRRLRAGECGASKTNQYVAAMTAFALEEDRRECFASGMNDYLSKPLNFSALRDALIRAWRACASR